MLKISRSVVIISIIFFALFSIGRDTQTTFELKTHTRYDFEDYKNLANYLKNFSDLVIELEKPQYEKSLALATFDKQVYEWWSTFKNGLIFTPDVFFSTQTDSVLESRLLRVGSILGFSAGDFVDFLARRTINYFFLGAVKYQLFKAHTYSSLSDYEPKDIERYNNTDNYSFFTLAVPISEKKRLSQKFENEKNRGGISPDLIILDSSPVINVKEPNSKMYRLTFSNEVFRVWVKRLAAN